MISRLPNWVETGAFVLALIAGYVNAIGFLSFEHQSVSHVSGTATLIGVGLLSSSMAQLLHLVGVLVAFFFGAAIAGVLVHGATLKLGRHYDTALVIEALLLLGAMVLLSEGSSYGHFLASAACGLQNALATTYSGAIVRTTHVTGIFTDLGLMLGAALRKQPFDRRKAKLFLIIVCGFIFGGTAGTYAYTQWLYTALVLPSGACLLLAALYHGYRRRRREDLHVE